MVFRVSDVVAARDLIRERTLEVPGLKANIPPKFHDNVVTIADAAKAAHVQPATIRSWIHRGHITPMDPGSRPRRCCAVVTFFRLPAALSLDPPIGLGV